MRVKIGAGDEIFEFYVLLREYRLEASLEVVLVFDREDKALVLDLVDRIKPNLITVH